MSFSGFLAELRHRGVLKVAAAYLLVTGVVVLESVSILFHNFEAPHLVLKALSTLVILGFPVACLMAWGFEFTSQGGARGAVVCAGNPGAAGRLLGIGSGLPIEHRARKDEGEPLPCASMIKWQA